MQCVGLAQQATNTTTRGESPPPPCECLGGFPTTLALSPWHLAACLLQHRPQCTLPAPRGRLEPEPWRWQAPRQGDHHSWARLLHQAHTHTCYGLLQGTTPRPPHFVSSLPQATAAVSWFTLKDRVAPALSMAPNTPFSASNPTCNTHTFFPANTGPAEPAAPVFAPPLPLPLPLPLLASMPRVPRNVYLSPGMLNESRVHETKLVQQQAQDFFCPNTMVCDATVGLLLLLRGFTAPPPQQRR